MGAGRLFDEPGGAADDAARVAALEAELDAARLQAEAQRVENEQLHEANEQLRDELASHEACASLPSDTDNAAAGKPFSGGEAPSPATLAGMLATLEARQADLAARAAGEHSGDVGDVQVVGRDLVEVVEASRRLQGLCAAVQAEALAGLNQVQHVPSLPPHVSSRSMRAETLTGAEAGAALLVSRDSAGLRTAEALTLTRVFTRTLGALREGALTEWHARILLHESAQLSDDQRRRVEAEVLEYACGHTGPQLRARIKQVIARIAPTDTEQAHARARAGRRVWAQPGLDGMGTFGAELPVEDLAALMTAIEAAASAEQSASPDDGRTMDHRRADALAAMGWSALTTGHIGAPAPTSRGTNASSTNGDTTANTETSTGTDSGSATTGTEASSPSAQPAAGESSAQGPARDGPGRCCRGAVNTESSAAAESATGSAAGSAGGGLRLQNTRGKPVTDNVTVPYSTLIGIDDHPGQLAGYGTITADVARRIATLGTWRRILTDPINGAPLDYGRTRYEPPPDLAAFIALRDGRCVFPGCSRTAHTSQVDHTTPYSDGGPTSHDNLGCLDQVCHLLKTFAGWTVTQNPHRPGHFDWTSPLGYTHTVEPEPVGPIVQAEADPGEGPEEQDIPPF